MSNAYYVDELLLDTVIKAEKLIEHKLAKDEAKLAVECATQLPAFAELTGKNGSKFVVSRERNYNSKTGDYIYHVQLMDNDLNVIEEIKYRKAIKGDHGYKISEYVRAEDGYSVEPLMHIAMTVLRRTSH